jgi:hypothetical protein
MGTTDLEDLPASNLAGYLKESGISQDLRYHVVTPILKTPTVLECDAVFH